MERKAKVDSFSKQRIKTRNVLFLVFCFVAVSIIVVALMGYQDFKRQHRFIITHIDQSEPDVVVTFQFWYMVVFLVFMIMSISMIIWYIYRRKGLIFYRAQYNLLELLKESENRYHRLFEAAMDGILLVNFDTGLILDVNPSLIDLSGYSKSEFLEKQLWDVGVFKDAALSRYKFLELQKKVFFRYEELPLETKEGKKILVEFFSNVYSDGDRKIIQCNIRDITARKRLEKELRQANEREYKTLLENLPQKVFLKNKNSVYISCNNSYARDLGISSEEIAGKTDFDFFPAYLAEKYRTDDKRVMESGKIENIEEKYVVINDFLGGSKHAVINAVKIPIRNKTGNVVGMFGLFWDITERREAQDDLYKSWQMFETIVNGITDPVLLLSTDFKIIWANKASIQQFGLTIEEILGQHCYNVIHKQGRRCRSTDYECPIGEIVKTGKPKTVMHTHINKNGELFLVEVTIFPVKDKDGEVIQFIHLERDVTECKRAEDELKRIEALKTSTEMRLHFTSIVSHELRSPLVAIKEGINLVLEGLAGNINAEQKDLLDIAKRNADRLSRLINNVLDFQRIESGRVKFDIRQNDIKEVALEVSNNMGILAGEKGLDLVVEADDNIPRIGFDRDRIIQVMTNLVNNAIKYTEEGWVTISIKQEASAVHVKVQDTGLGIKDEDIQKLFLDFEQLDGAEGKNKGGTGLGLAISKEIIFGHNGKIWAESEVGKGSVFHFTLPIK